MPSRNAVAALKQATKGLTYQSESDAPFKTFTWRKAEGDLTGAAILKRARKKAGTPVEELSLDDFFGDLVQEQDWHGDEEKATVAQYRRLVSVLKDQLSGAKVFKVGGRKKDVFVVGKTPAGDWAGVRTQAVET